MATPRMARADLPDGRVMWYLLDDNLDFVPEVKEFLDWKAATRRAAPSTIEGYCYRLSWYYRFLGQRGLSVIEVAPAHLVDFVTWLCNPYRDLGNVQVIHDKSPLRERTVNLILQAVASLYFFLVRRGVLAESPVKYEDVLRSRWLVERDLLAHTRRGESARTVQRMELKLKEPRQLPKVVQEPDFRAFLESMRLGKNPRSYPSAFRDRVMCLLLKEGGLRIGELLGMRLEDMDFGKGGAWVRFRPDNKNAARAKAGFGRDRFVHLPPDVMGLLDIYVTEVWLDAGPSHDYLWVVFARRSRDRDGVMTHASPLPRGAVEKQFEYYSRKSGVKVTPHMLRHSHVSDLVRSYLREGKAVDWKFIQERIGHASVVTTMMIYTHLTDEDRKQAYDAYLQRRELTRGNRKGTESSGS